MHYFGGLWKFIAMSSDSIALTMNERHACDYLKGEADSISRVGTIANDVVDSGTCTVRTLLLLGFIQAGIVLQYKV